MALGTSNTFNLPSQSSSLVLSRDSFNNSLRALLQNFYSTGRPDTENFTNQGSSMSGTDYNGVLYRKADWGSLYVYDTTIQNGVRTNNPVGGSFTKYGIAWRLQDSVAAATSNLAQFDLGEAFVIVGSTPTSTAKDSTTNRMYVRVALTGSFNNDFLDVGTPPPGSASFTGNLNVSDGNVNSTGAVNGNRGVYAYNTSAGSSGQSIFQAQVLGAAGAQFGQAKNKDMFLYNGESSNLVISTNAIQRMKIHQNGSVEIGPAYGATTANLSISPTYIDAADGNCAKIRLYDDGLSSYGIGLQGGQTNIVAGYRASGPGAGGLIGFFTNSTRAMTITSDPSNVTIGNGTTNSARLHVLGDIKATGDITAFYSDDRLKNKLGTIKDSLNKVKQLTGFYYEANEIANELGYESRRDVGISAQEVQKVLPEAVVAAPISDDYLTVHYHKIIPLMIEAIKELDERITNLEEKL